MPEKILKWNGFNFEKGQFAVLDIFGTNRDPDIWDKPNDFNPERFKDWKGNAFDFIPQGGGNHYTGHRCAGEWITIEVTKLFVKFLTGEIEYNVPIQDLTYSLSRMPTMPKSRFVISNIRIKESKL